MPATPLNAALRRSLGDGIVPASRASAAVIEVETAHHAASRNAKDLRLWQPQRVSPDAALLPELDTITARSEDLTRNNGIAAGAEQTHLDNIVGTGLRLVAMPDYRALGRSKEWADGWADDVEALWRSFADTVEVDAARQLTFRGMTRVVFRTVLAAGEALALPLWLPEKGLPWATTLQLVDPARLSNPIGRQDTATLRGGIEIDQYGEPLAYHIRKSHPGDLFGLNFAAGGWERIPARMPFGRMRVLHVFEKERIGQSRASPLVTAVMRQFKMLDQYEREELRTAVIHSLIAAFMETPLDQAAFTEMLGASDTDYQAAVAEWNVQLKGGSVIPLPPGTKMSPFTPTRPSGTFDAFVTAMLRHLAVGLNLPYELLAKDFSKTNYSSARAALMEAWRYFLGRRQWLTEVWAQPVYELWLEEAVNAGAVDAPDFYPNRVAWCRSKWIGAGRGWIDPTKEIEAARMRLETGISTLEAECAEQGTDWREVQDQRAREQTYVTSLGLPDPYAPKAAAAPMLRREPEQAEAAAA